MAEVAVGFMDRSNRVSRPRRGARVAAATRHFMGLRGLTVSELAFQAKVDKRDLRRLLADQSCGGNLEDDLEAFFGWDFTEMVAHAVHGADPTTSREAELARQLAEAAALQSRIERDRELRAATAPRLAVVAGEHRVPRPSRPREQRAFGPPTPLSET